MLIILGILGLKQSGPSLLYVFDIAQSRSNEPILEYWISG